MSGKDINRILATDCGSTTTKAILIEKDADRHRLKYRGEAPTTVEDPFKDVKVGFFNAVKQIENESGYQILDGKGGIITPAYEKNGVDVYVSTSSAGGGLQMMVAGGVEKMTVESGIRSALGAGGIVSLALAINDNRPDYERVRKIRQSRPDMILLCGGTDGGNSTIPLLMAELIKVAGPKPRFGEDYKLPIIFAGNKELIKAIQDKFGDEFAVYPVPNVRPTLEIENLGPARQEVHRIFLEHVMQQAPGYRGLIELTSKGIMSTGIMPTPSAVGDLVNAVAEEKGIQVIGVDIGGATTDVFSVLRSYENEGKTYKTNFNRTVSANLGLSYSISNVLKEAGLDNILRWIPYDLKERGLNISDIIGNKMIRPTTIPQILEELQVEQAVAREALRLAFKHHQTMAVGLKGVQQQRTISEAFDQKQTGESLVDMLHLDYIIGSGGPLSHTPNRMQAASMMMDAFQPEGFTYLYVDSVFMMPHLGVLSQINKEAAMEVFWNDCLIPLCPTIVPRGKGKEGKPCLTLKMEGLDKPEVINYGEIKAFPLVYGKEAKVEISLEKGFEFEKKQRKLETKLTGGQLGSVIIDARGRPLVLPEDTSERNRKLNLWWDALKLY